MRGIALSALAGLLFSAPLLAHGPESMDGVPDAVPEARITEAPALEGLTAMVLEGAPQGIWLSYSGPGTVTVLDRHGAPMLRFTPEGVQAHTASTDSPVTRSSDTGDWVTVSRSDGYGWMDPRLQVPGHHSGDASRRWRIPLSLSGGEQATLAGQLEWRDLPETSGH